MVLQFYNLQAYLLLNYAKLSFIVAHDDLWNHIRNHIIMYSIQLINFYVILTMWLLLLGSSSTLTLYWYILVLYWYFIGTIWVINILKKSMIIPVCTTSRWLFDIIRSEEHYYKRIIWMNFGYFLVLGKCPLCPSTPVDSCRNQGCANRDWARCCHEQAELIAELRSKGEGWIDGYLMVV